MKDEDLTFKPSQKEYYAPEMSFTWLDRETSLWIFILSK